jgi:hypothetical protein
MSAGSDHASTPRIFIRRSEHFRSPHAYRPDCPGKPPDAREGRMHLLRIRRHLRFLGWWRNDDRTGGPCRLPPQPADEAFDAGVASRECVAVHQVLIDGLGVSSLAQRQFDEVEVRLAGTTRRAPPGQRDRRRVGGHRWPVLAELGVRAGRQVGGHLIGRFCRCPPPPTSGSPNGEFRLL